MIHCLILTLVSGGTAISYCQPPFGLPRSMICYVCVMSLFKDYIHNPCAPGHDLLCLHYITLPLRNPSSLTMICCVYFLWLLHDEIKLIEEFIFGTAWSAAIALVIWAEDRSRFITKTLDLATSLTHPWTHKTQWGRCEQAVWLSRGITQPMADLSYLWHVRLLPELAVSPMCHYPCGLVMHPCSPNRHKHADPECPRRILSRNLHISHIDSSLISLFIMCYTWG